MAGNSDYQIKTRNQMKTIDVIFVSDELVGEIIPSRKEHERLVRQRIKAENDKLLAQKNEEGENNVAVKTRKRKHNEEISEVNAKKSKYIDDVELALAALENGEVEKVTINQPSTLFDEQEDISASKIYKFENNSQNHTPSNLKSCIKSPVTPKNKLNVSFSNKENDTPKSRNRLDAIQEESSATTPYSLRKKVIKDIKEIRKILENSDDDFSASESEYSVESSEESATEETEEAKKPVRRKAVNYTMSSANYFESQSVKKSMTSNNTLKKLKTPRLTQEKLDEIFKNIEMNAEHKNSVKVLFNEHLTLFRKWDFILKQNYNILLYGVGSKKELVNKFVERFFNKHPVIVVNGFFPSVTVKEILDKICQILKIDSDASDVVDRIQNKITDYNLKIYLAVNNIDGIMLRNKKAQNLLSRFGKMEQIHIIATIDHINAPLIWDKCSASDFNWIWYDTSTYISYTEEIVYEGNLMLQNSGQLTLSSLRNVFNSLTKNSRGIFILILKNQLDDGNKKNGISFRQLYQECRKEFLISSDVALRSQLKEFLDHLILKQKRNAEGEERFVISIDNSILKQFLEEQERC